MRADRYTDTVAPRTGARASARNKRSARLHRNLPTNVRQPQSSRMAAPTTEGKDKYWEEMNESERKAAELLGWAQVSEHALPLSASCSVRSDKWFNRLSPQFGYCGTTAAGAAFMPPPAASGFGGSAVTFAGLTQVIFALVVRANPRPRPPRPRPRARPRPRPARPRPPAAAPSAGASPSPPPPASPAAAVGAAASAPCAAVLVSIASVSRGDVIPVAQAARALSAAVS